MVDRSPPGASDACARLEPLHSAWIDGALRMGERVALGAHLQRCARCRHRINGLRVTQSMLRSFPVRRLPADVLGSAHVVEPEPRPRARVARTTRWLARSAAGVAAALTLVGAAAFVAGGDATTVRTVAVPVEVFVADHLVHTVGGPVSTPVLLEPRP